MSAFKTASHIIVLSLVTLSLLHCKSGSSSPPAAAPPIVLKSFVTTTSGSGDLSTWPDAIKANATGLAAADAVCQARASAAGLTGTFRAWLSDETTDAYCRMHGLNGTKSNKCGQTTLPASAGPWVRTDGEPFAEVISKLTTSLALLTPGRYNETGSISTAPWVWTGTNTDGTATLTSTCSGWTSTVPVSVMIGSMEQTYNVWSGGGNGNCIDTLPLLCMQQGPGLPLTYQTSGKKVFKSSISGQGNLALWSGATGTGIAAGDSICNERAAAAGLSGTYKAWLSDGSTDAVSRLTSSGPWIRADGVKLAADKTDLTDGTLMTNLIVTESGDYSAGIAWTGTTNAGLKTADTCNGWTDNTVTYKGTAGYIDIYGLWSEWTSFTCDNSGYLYCFED